MTKISLARVLVEIKTITEKLSTFPIVVGVASNKTGLVEGTHDTKEQFEATSQSRFDEWMALKEKLVKLKVARNLANATTMVTVNGVEMTIDQLIARKAMLPIMQTAVTAIIYQMNAAERTITKATADVNTELSKSIGGIGAAVDENQVQTLTNLYTKTVGKTVAKGINIKAGLEAMQKEIVDFGAVADYTLSEANATTMVEIQ